MDENIAQTVRDLAVALNDFSRINGDGAPYTVVPQSYRIENLERFLLKPLRVRGARQFVALESFNRYVSQFKQADTRIMLSRNGNATAVLDASGPANPQWEEHTANFAVTYSDRWTLWDGASRRPMTQKQFAEFVEDNNADIISPKPAQMLEIAQTLQVEQNSNFRSAIRLENGNVNLGYQRQTTAKAGQNDELEIPSQFTIQIPVLEAESARQIPVRLRYELSDGKLSLTFEILQRQRLLDDVKRSIYATIASDTGIEPLLVA